MQITDELKKAVCEAFLKAIKETGDAYKQMSWFGRNKKSELYTLRLDYCI